MLNPPSRRPILQAFPHFPQSRKIFCPTTLGILCTRCYMNDRNECAPAPLAGAIPDQLLSGQAAFFSLRHNRTTGVRHSQIWPSAMLAALCVLTSGCAMPPKRPVASMIVPSRCMKMTVQSFTRPCRQRPDGKLVCDAVVVDATCVETVQAVQAGKAARPVSQ